MSNVIIQEEEHYAHASKLQKLHSMPFPKLNCSLIQVTHTVLLYYHIGNEVVKEPFIGPDKQMESLKIICNANTDDIRIVPDDI